MKNIAKRPGQQPNADIVALLNQSLADMLALKINAKQAHWNVKGENFIALHELFDKVSAQADAYADMLAERAVQLGGPAEGSIGHIAKRAARPDYPQTTDAQKHIRALSGQLMETSDHMRDAIDTSDHLGDAVSADIFTQIAGGLDKYQWFVSSHQK
jgi:starvation-inducible DNA-binding protein